MSSTIAQPTFSLGTFPPPPGAASLTSFASSSKFVLLGLSTGTLLLFDVFGNLLDTHTNLHVGPIPSVSLTHTSFNDDIVASVGRARHDVRVARLSSSVNMLVSATPLLAKHVDIPVKHIAVDPHFGRPRFGDRVAWAQENGRVVVYTGGWFGGRELEVREGGTSEVMDLKWTHYLLAYSTEEGVKVWDTRLNRPVCVVAPPGNTAPTSPVRHIGDLKGFREVADDGDSDDGLWEPEDEEHPDDINRNSSTDWVCRTKIFMHVDERVPLSPHGEPAIMMYVTWPTGARVIHIGALVDGETPELPPTRDKEVVFKLDRPDIFAPHLEENIQGNIGEGASESDVWSSEQAPLLGVVPFGDEDMVALVGTSLKGLVIHLISDKTKRSEKYMALPQTDLKDADLLTVPGGDPLVLVAGQWLSPATPKEVSHEEERIDGRELMFVRSLTTAERVKWLLGQNRFSDALHIAQNAPGGSLRRAEVSLEDIGEQFLDSLREAGEFVRLATVLPETITATTPYVGNREREKVMKKRIKRWNRWIRNFREAGKLSCLAPSIPTYEPCLQEDSYNGILLELAASDPSVMLDVLKTWPADVFGVSTVTKAIEEELSMMDTDKVSDKNNEPERREALREGLLMMYGLSGRHDETLNLLLREKSPKVYDYIRSHHLFEAVRAPETIKGLFEIDAGAATDILSHAPETVLPPEAVVPILDKVNNSEWTYMYLHAVFRMDVDQAPKYHNKLLKLYVVHGKPGMLFNFLRTSTHYSLDRALKEMGGPRGLKRGELADERVYVLSQMGDLNSAMDILLDEIGDTFSAIEFASDHGDTELWERLIEHARTHADTLAALLDSPAGGKVDPVRLVPLLTSEMRIPRLRDRLHRILVDAALERALREDAAAALHHDASELLRSLDECVSTFPTSTM